MGRMKKDDPGVDELRAEYDLKNLKLRKAGPDRKRFEKPTGRLESDVAELLPNSESINEALCSDSGFQRQRNRSVSLRRENSG